MSFSLGITFTNVNWEGWFNGTADNGCIGDTCLSQQEKGQLYRRFGSWLWKDTRFWQYNHSDTDRDLHIFPDERDPWAKRPWRRGVHNADEVVTQPSENDQPWEGMLKAQELSVLFAGGSLNVRSLPDNITVVEIHMNDPNIKPFISTGKGTKTALINQLYPFQQILRNAISKLFRNKPECPDSRKAHNETHWEDWQWFHWYNQYRLISEQCEVESK